MFYWFSEKLIALYQFHLHYQIGQPISKRTRNWLRNFIKLYPGGFAEYTNPQFQNSQKFALDGGVIFDTLANKNESRADEVLISAL